MPAKCAPLSITDFLKTELDKKLASLPTDRARINMLARQYGIWTQNMQNFWRRCEQPFGGPHPVHGDMTPGDFIIVLGMINSARHDIERQAVLA